MRAKTSPWERGLSTRPSIVLLSTGRPLCRVGNAARPKTANRRPSVSGTITRDGDSYIYCSAAPVGRIFALKHLLRLVEVDARLGQAGRLAEHACVVVRARGHLFGEHT